MQTAPSAVIIGTCHEYQRHQDNNAERETARSEFEKLLRSTIKERGIELIAEEAGTDAEVWDQLKRDEAITPTEFEVFFANSRTVDEPQPTIAKMLADALLGGRHFDIRNPDAEAMSIEECDEAMARRTAEIRGDARSVLVIVGKVHRRGVKTILQSGFGWEVAPDITFPPDALPALDANHEM